MYVVVWRFRSLVGRESEFEQAYGPSGEWTQLFRGGEGYLGTELLRRSEDPSEYLATDRWTSRVAYEAFRARFSSEYRRTATYIALAHLLREGGTLRPRLKLFNVFSVKGYNPWRNFRK